MPKENAVLTIGSLKTSFLKDTENFLKSAKAEIVVVNHARSSVEKAKGANITLGLYMSVLSDHFDFTLAPAKSPEYFVHKGDTVSYVRGTLGIAKGQPFPSTAWNNASVVFQLVVLDAEKQQVLSEADYLALAQSDLDCLRRTMKFLTEKDMSVDVRQNADILEMVGLCQKRQDGYRKALKVIEDRVTGKGAEKQAEEITLAHAALVVTVHVKAAGDQAPEDVKAIAFLVLSIMDTFLHQSGLTDEMVAELTTEYSDTGISPEIKAIIAAKAAAEDAAVQARRAKEAELNELAESSRALAAT